MRYVIQFFNIYTNELLGEDDLNVDSREEAEQYAENWIEDFSHYTECYYQIN